MTALLLQWCRTCVRATPTWTWQGVSHCSVCEPENSFFAAEDDDDDWDDSDGDDEP